MTDAVGATDTGRPGAGACVIEQRSSRLGRADILVVNTGERPTMPPENISADNSLIFRSTHPI
ncbi:hypothetical protein [Mesorhizobium sp. M0040]|uniref:hypothetical protein n=1 Tax=Mesorhizobium sp. M0040 TaxID=2956855 RepID=UPI003335F0F0